MLILALALHIVGVRTATIARAAPDAAETIDRFDISTSPIPTPACANSRYPVQFFIGVDRVADLNGSQVNLEGGLGPADILVSASSSDISVAAFQPEERTATALDGRIGRGAEFALVTGAPGSATLTFKSSITWTGNRVVLAPLQQPIKVVNCRFKVTITSIAAGFGPNITETVVSDVQGQIEPSREGPLKGEAEATWRTQQASECLAIVQDVVPSPAKAALQGSLSQDGSSLTVQVTYDQLGILQTNRITCILGSVSSQSFQFQPPPLTFTVPTTGRVISQPVSLRMGELGLSGTAIITVEPIESQ